MLPGGFAEAILGQSATPETVAAFNQEIGLDRPAVVRYVEWIGQASCRAISARPMPAAAASSSATSPTMHRAAPLQHAFPRHHGRRHRRAAGAGARRRSPRSTATACSTGSVNSITLTTIALPEFFIAYMLALIVSRDTFRHAFAELPHGWRASMVLCLAEFPTLANVNDQTPSASASRAPHAARPDPHPGHRRPHDAHDPRRDHQSARQPLYRDGAAQGPIPRGESSCATPCPMPGRRSSPSSPSISPIWSSASWWSRWCSSIPASAS